MTEVQFEERVTDEQMNVCCKLAEAEVLLRRGMALLVEIGLGDKDDLLTDAWSDTWPTVIEEAFDSDESGEGKAFYKDCFKGSWSAYRRNQIERAKP